MTVTVKDVAKKAGVATSTVSRVINDHPSISDATKKRVMKVMDELGYVPNIAAQNLGKRKSNAIGVILPPLDSKERMGNPFFLEIIEAINEEALANNLTTAVATATNYEKLLENVKKMHSQRQVDGFVLVYSDKDDPVIAYLCEKDIPFSLIGQPYQQEDNIVYVDNDNQLLGKHATDFLIENGHKDILFITNTIHENIFFERYFGYQKSLMMNNLPHHTSINLINAEDYEAFGELLAEKKYSAAVVIDDMFAVKVIQLVQMYGYKVPEDFSIVSFNNSIIATMVHPYLTSMDISVQELGKLGLRQLVKSLGDEEASSLRMVIPHKLIRRETVIDLNQ
ncbi:LacI family DNA-binding transcriptional regulator [Vagococcus xieshaowenii]|uniref:LacI family transcriptional regulator n=1 Tax=Vagococcus xieshaowenii TaxID=2562451 RepID=A0AAJ5JQA3_9ENTE|nr:LacI family DNA-binding transcriptional regulator [Vagococcus xieshaowenii]QCA28116.1 LacI family transcriptional regulator [Vagococcus xieshaowenii]TFZ40159.1 LacI family transcriptional regulator [Vagococcus xieshaowenii]